MVHGDVSVPRCHATNQIHKFFTFNRGFLKLPQGIDTQPEVGGNGGSNGPDLGVACLISIYILSAQLELSPISLSSQLQRRLAQIVQLCAQERSKISFMTVSKSLSLYLFQQLKVTPRGTSKLAEEKKGSQKFLFTQQKGRKGGKKQQGKRMANRKYKIKQEKSLQRYQ